MTSRSLEPFRIAAAQLSPVPLNRVATIHRACDAIAEAGRAGAWLIVLDVSDQLAFGSQLHVDAGGWLDPVAGHYGRPDVFRPTVDRSTRPPVVEAMTSPRATRHA